MPVTLLGTLDGEPTSWAPDLGLYSDNVPYAKGLPPEDMVVEDIVIRQTSLQDFITGLMYADTLFNWHEFHDEEPGLVVPFFPGARQDRVNLGGDVLDTKRWLMDVIDSMLCAAGGLTVFDMHSENGDPSFDYQNITAAQIIAGYTKAGGSINPTEGYYDTIIAPDHGAWKRAEQVGAIYHTPVMVAEKVRDTSDGRITSYAVDWDNYALNKVLVVDDICDGGATFELLAKALPKDTEKHLYVTHGLFSRGVAHLKHHYDHIVTTNSVYRETGQGVQVIDLFPGMDVK